MSNKTISVAEASRRSGISTDQINAAARRDGFRSWMSGRSRRVHLESFNVWLEERRAKDPQYSPPASPALLMQEDTARAAQVEADEAAEVEAGRAASEAELHPRRVGAFVCTWKHCGARTVKTRFGLPDFDASPPKSCGRCGEDPELINEDPISLEPDARFALLEKLGLVRLVAVPDDQCTFENYEGDTYNAQANPDIPAEQLAKEREEALAQFTEDGGAFGLRGDISLHGHWQHVDSVWGLYPRSYAEDPLNEYRDGIIEQVLKKVDELLAGIA